MKSKEEQLVIAMIVFVRMSQLNKLLLPFSIDFDENLDKKKGEVFRISLQ